MRAAASNGPDSAATAKRAAAKVVAAWVVLPLFFLVTGGSTDWWQAWTYCLVVLVPMTVFVAVMVRRHPEFIARRSTYREKERTQRNILAWGVAPLVGMFVLPGLDHRFGWSEPPAAAVIAAMLASLAGYLAILGVFVLNRWAGRTIETYEDQQVVSTGPYAIVRHPMYAASTVLYLATPLALGSWWAILPAAAFIPIFVLRIRHEEALLVRDLPGYDEYRRTVRYRLVPFVW